MVAEASNMVNSVTVKRAWNKLKGMPTKEEAKKEKKVQEQESEETGEDKNVTGTTQKHSSKNS